jgi:hypothetical protein
MISILNFVFTIVFSTTRWTKLDLTCICFEEFLNQPNLLYKYDILLGHTVWCRHPRWHGVVNLGHKLHSPCQCPATQLPPYLLSIVCVSLSLWLPVPSPLNHRCSISLPRTLDRHSSLRCSTLALSLALGQMGIRFQFCLGDDFDPPVNVFRQRISITISDQSGRQW